MAKQNILKKVFVGFLFGAFLGVGGLDLSLAKIGIDVSGVLIVLLLIASFVIFFLAGYKYSDVFWSLFNIRYDLPGTNNQLKEIIVRDRTMRFYFPPF